MVERVLNQTMTLSNGVEIPVLGLGVWKSSNTEASDAVQSAIRNGYRLIDTAKQYGNQPGVGVGIQKALKDNHLNRKDLFITTKVYNGDQGYESTLRAFEEQLKELRLTYLDLYLIHWPVDGKYIDTWRAMEKLYREGRVRAIGVSNFDISCLQDLLDHTDIMPQVNQMEFNPLVQEEELIGYMNAIGMSMEAWSPLGGGQALNNPTILEIAQKHDKTSAQVILRFNYQMGLITIPKSVHEERIIANTMLDDFELSESEMLAIQQLNQEKRSLWYEDFAWHTPHRQQAFADSVDSWDDRSEYLPK
ncbi:aldo/keto reductase [Convivina praedatoris]|uniref:Glyoxal reductase n=1 Tax=Convivina praedatoris TaxID=2880963 RepID=A0ABM9D3Y7_9LACO|nr:aldo/keto reductase [Convivina sp. LMG 32447]CAH1851498.1 Glyoxal reductase [Convivina sp. LMG 32447]CAH1853541.1 Glyoxal reductase [Convivina sp. LMG 32447]CAH1854500.1 Glyoxal reductase [Convivina sp. LMG 32447]